MLEYIYFDVHIIAITHLKSSSLRPSSVYTLCPIHFIYIYINDPYNQWYLCCKYLLVARRSRICWICWISSVDDQVLKKDCIGLWRHSLDITLWKFILFNSRHLDEHFIQWAQSSISAHFSTRWPQSWIFQIPYFIDMYIKIYVFEHAG